MISVWHRERVQIACLHSFAVWVFFFLLTSVLNCICRELLESLYLHLTEEIGLGAPYSSCSPAEYCLDTSNSLSFWAEGSKSREECAAAPVVNRTEELTKSCCCVVGKRLGIGRVLDYL